MAAGIHRLDKEVHKHSLLPLRIMVCLKLPSSSPTIKPECLPFSGLLFKAPASTLSSGEDTGIGKEGKAKKLQTSLQPAVLTAYFLGSS